MSQLRTRLSVTAKKLNARKNTVSASRQACHAIYSATVAAVKIIKITLKKKKIKRKKIPDAPARTPAAKKTIVTAIDLEKAAPRDVNVLTAETVLRTPQSKKSEFD